MAARKFGPEEHDRDDGDCMAQIQELQELLAEQAAGSQSPPTGVVRQLAKSIMLSNLFNLPSHHGDHALSLHWCPPLTTTTRTDSHF
jgi:hypothetical protein